MQRLLFYCFTVLLLLSTTQSNAQKKCNEQLKGSFNFERIKWSKKVERIAFTQDQSSHYWGIHFLDLPVGEADENGEYMCEISTIVSAKFDEIKFCKPSFYEEENEETTYFLEVTKNNQTGIIPLWVNPSEPYTASNEPMFFDQVLFKKKKDLHEKKYCPIQMNGKWGLFNIIHQEIAIPCQYNSAQEIPKNDVQFWESSKGKLYLQFDADSIQHDPFNGDGVLNARNKDTKKWGMYQRYDDQSFDTLIPPNYDSLNFFRFNAMFTQVFQNGKVGIYLSKWSYGENTKESVPCIYEDYQIFNANGTRKLAVKKDGKWGYVNWLTGEEKYGFKYDSKDDLPYPYFLQESSFK